MTTATFGLIGAGRLSQAQHLPNLRWAPHADLKVVCDVDEDVAKAAQAKYGVEKCESDYRRVLADPEVEAVVIAVGPEQHAELTIDARIQVLEDHYDDTINEWARRNSEEQA